MLQMGQSTVTEETFMGHPISSLKARLENNISESKDSDDSTLLHQAIANNIPMSTRVKEIVLDYIKSLSVAPSYSNLSMLESLLIESVKHNHFLAKTSIAHWCKATCARSPSTGNYAYPPIISSLQLSIENNVDPITIKFFIMALAKVNRCSYADIINKQKLHSTNPKIQAELTKLAAIPLANHVATSSTSRQIQERMYSGMRPVFLNRPSSVTAATTAPKRESFSSSFSGLRGAFTNSSRRTTPVNTSSNSTRSTAESLPRAPTSSSTIFTSTQAGPTSDTDLAHLEDLAKHANDLIRERGNFHPNS